MPAEWQRHSATQLHWPSNRKTWPGKRLELVEKVYCKLIEELHFYEPIHLFVESLEVRNRVMQKLSGLAVDLDRIIIHQQKINDLWARDCGPMFVKKENEYLILDWGYNAWGEKYSPWDDDNALPEFIAKKFEKERIEPGMVLEGGSIDGNGRGALLTTESVLLNSNRNPHLSKAEIGQNLKHYLGVDQVIWLKKGLAGDKRDGHVTNVTRWLNEDSVLTMISEDEDDINYSALQENLKLLQSIRLQSGRSLNIETLPLQRIKNEQQKFMSASYASFYIANGVILVPVYGKEDDEKALGLFRKYYPGRKVIGVPSADLIWGQGSIHSITRQWYGI